MLHDIHIDNQKKHFKNSLIFTLKQYLYQILCLYDLLNLFNFFEGEGNSSKGDQLDIKLFTPLISGGRGGDGSNSFRKEFAVRETNLLL